MLINQLTSIKTPYPKKKKEKQKKRKKDKEKQKHQNNITRYQNNTLYNLYSC
jgi:hypothetical protein